MKGFRYSVPTAILFGSDCITENGALFKGYGEKACIFTKQFVGGARNLALEDVEATFKAEGIDYIIVDDVEENPPVLSIEGMANKVREYGPDFMIAVGGGSAMDTSKAVAVLVDHPGKDPYEVFFGGGYPTGNTKGEKTIPLFAVPTTAGTGSEVTGYAVLTREDTHTKLAMSQVVYFENAFLNYRYIKDSPSFLIHNGAIDALAHGVETYVNNRSNFMNRSVAEIGFKLFSEFKDAMYNDSMTQEDFEKIILAATVQGMAFMQAGTTLPHGMGYALSHFKHVPHGHACGIFLGEYLKAFKDQTIVEPIVKMCGFDTVDAFAQYIKDICARDVKIEVTQQELNEWAEDFCKLEVRLVKHPEKIGVEEISTIYNNALAAYIK